MNGDDFLYRDLPAVGKRVHRLGLAFNYGLDGAGTRAAFDNGVNFIFWAKFRKGDQHAVVKDALRRDRERYVLATGVPFGYFAGNIRRGVERVLRSFEVQYVDVFQLFWFGVMSRFTKGVQRELVKLREEGLVRALGTSIHNRKRAGRLAADSILNSLMIRYNAAHPGAENDIFPHYSVRRPLTIAYTATSWRKLLKKPKGWEGEAMTAGDCYRFCLSNPNVDVTLCAPANLAQLSEDLAALGKGLLSPEEDERFRRFGRAVHG